MHSNYSYQDAVIENSRPNTRPIITDKKMAHFSNNSQQSKSEIVHKAPDLYQNGLL